jgi:putative SOS response-associated peptidase YedK
VEGSAEIAPCPRAGHRLLRVADLRRWQEGAALIHDPAGEQLVLAGLYSWWKNHALPDDHPDVWTLTATILASDAVDELLHIHDRNPLPLPRDWWDTWLDPNIEGDQNLVNAAVRAALPVAAGLEVHEVDPIPFRANGPQLIEPATHLEGDENWLTL